MKSTELRIGNLVYGINRRTNVHLPTEIPLKVLQIELFNCETLPHELNPASEEKYFKISNADITGIPITEDWLKKFGFIIEQNEPLHKNLKYCDFSHRTKNYRIYLSDFKKHNSIHFAAGDGWFPELVEFEFVHQLQNIYHSLTNEELKIVSLEALAKKRK